ncbi:hypothetical protein BGW38_003764 [Lunasporangiospora selenospora]|uniref:Uncharacterized protein n=1 Tax=Lunasporangiospora selenospora TaxID=979761 RepID=A0A9P6G1K1_9FUNG|nr:hypothetical protein BGW38_003764 [Lunasporangiospora selenospora]
MAPIVHEARASTIGHGVKKKEFDLLLMDGHLDDKQRREHEDLLLKSHSDPLKNVHERQQGVARARHWARGLVFLLVALVWMVLHFLPNEPDHPRPSTLSSTTVDLPNWLDTMRDPQSRRQAHSSDNDMTCPNAKKIQNRIYVTSLRNITLRVYDNKSLISDVIVYPSPLSSPAIVITGIATADNDDPVEQDTANPEKNLYDNDWLQQRRRNRRRNRHWIDVAPPSEFVSDGESKYISYQGLHTQFRENAGTLEAFVWYDRVEGCADLQIAILMPLEGDRNVGSLTVKGGQTSIAIGNMEQFYFDQINLHVESGDIMTVGTINTNKFNAYVIDGEAKIENLVPTSPGLPLYANVRAVGGDVELQARIQPVKLDEQPPNCFRLASLSGSVTVNITEDRTATALSKSMSPSLNGATNTFSEENPCTRENQKFSLADQQDPSQGHRQIDAYIHAKDWIKGRFELIREDPSIWLESVAGTSSEYNITDTYAGYFYLKSEQETVDIISDEGVQNRTVSFTDAENVKSGEICHRRGGSGFGKLNLRTSSGQSVLVFESTATKKRPLLPLAFMLFIPLLFFSLFSRLVFRD